MSYVEDGIDNPPEKEGSGQDDDEPVLENQEWPYYFKPA